MRLEKDNAIRLFNCEAPGSEGIKLEEIFYEEKMGRWQDKEGCTTCP